SFVAKLWKPTAAGPGRKTKAAEEWFVTCLRQTYRDATGCQPPSVVNFNSQAPFFRFVEDCFEAAGIATPRSSAVRAINNVGHEIKMARLEAAFRYLARRHRRKDCLSGYFT